MVAVERNAGDGCDCVLVERVAVRVERARDDIHALHTQASLEGNGSLNGNSICSRELLAGKAGEILGGDGVEPVEGGDIVGMELRRLGNTEAAGRAADSADGLHHWPALRAAGFFVLERSGIYLRIVQVENVAEGAFKLEAHHCQHVCIGCAEAVEQKNGVGDGGVGVDVVDPKPDAVELATGGIACAGAEERVDHRTVFVEDNPHRILRCCGSNVGGLADLAQLVDLLVGHRKVCAACHDVGAVHVFVQRAFIGERDAGGGNGAPEGRRRIHHGYGLLVGDGAAERSLVDVIVQLPACPVNGLAEDR